jgi:hypothetical protein
MLQDSLVVIFVQEKLGAANANAVENIKNIGKELEIVDRTSQSVVTKMAGAVVVRLSTRPTRLSILQNTHSRVK